MSAKQGAQNAGSEPGEDLAGARRDQTTPEPGAVRSSSWELGSRVNYKVNTDHNNGVSSARAWECGDAADRILSAANKHLAPGSPLSSASFSVRAENSSWLCYISKQV